MEAKGQTVPYQLGSAKPRVQQCLPWLLQSLSKLPATPVNTGSQVLLAAGTLACKLDQTVSTKCVGL